MTHREPEFTPAEADLMLAFQAVEDAAGPYGIPLSEAMDADNQFSFKPSEKPSVNWAVKAVEDAKDFWYETHKGSSRNGHMWSVERKPQSS